ncbi:MAG: hypothetical protein ACRCVN_06395 [Spirochaetia bacterium]
MSLSKKNIYFAHLPSFCLLLVISVLPISALSIETQFYPIINFFIVILGSHLLQFFTQRFGIFINSLLLSILSFLTAMIPLIVNYISLEKQDPISLFICSLCLGSSWIIADVEKKMEFQLTTSATRIIRTTISFSLSLIIAITFRSYLGGPEETTGWGYRIFASLYWASLSGGFIISGLLLLVIELIEKWIFVKRKIEQPEEKL